MTATDIQKQRHEHNTEKCPYTSSHEKSVTERCYIIPHKHASLTFHILNLSPPKNNMLKPNDTLTTPPPPTQYTDSTETPKNKTPRIHHLPPGNPLAHRSFPKTPSHSPTLALSNSNPSTLAASRTYEATVDFCSGGLRRRDAMSWIERAW